MKTVCLELKFLIRKFSENCSGMPGLAQIEKFMCIIFKSEGIHCVEAYCLDNMLFYELSKFQVIKIYTF